jgi:hypothetical protein
MPSTEHALSPDWVKVELRRLRQGQGLAHPAVVMRLDERLRQLIIGDSVGHAADQVALLVAALRQAIGRLDSYERLFAEVDFNLVPEHSYPTLSDRQESLARERRCAVKTIRRHADRALDTLALVIALGEQATLIWPATARPASPLVRPASPPTRPAAAVRATEGPGATWSADARDSTGTGRWQRDLCGFWQLAPEATVDVVCSEIPSPDPPAGAAAEHGYLRYARFADIDSLVYVRTRLASACPDLIVRDFTSSEHHSADADTMIVIGGPAWNAKFREFLPHLPFHFADAPGGPVVVRAAPDRRLAPRRTMSHELLADVAVVTRLTLGASTVFLLAGCLSVGVLAAAQCFLHGERGAVNARYVTTMVGQSDFVLVVEARWAGGITEVPDLSKTEPMLLLARGDDGAFGVLANRTDGCLQLR